MHKSYTWKPIEAPTLAPSAAERRLETLISFWRDDRQRLQESGKYDVLWQRLVRHWSIETGIIEKIYDLTEGATRVLVEQGFDSAFIAHGDTNIDPNILVRILQDHRESIDFAMDIVGGIRDLSKSWICELHQLLTYHQESTQALSSDGRMVEIALSKGRFKTSPNNPYSANGELSHEYCPPEHVDTEMERLIQIYHTLPAERVALRSAWIHHAFTQIHPFQDGNGRAARVLASLDFIRAGLFPILVTRHERTKYLQALRAADDGDLEPLVTLFCTIQENVLRKAISTTDDLLTTHQSRASVIAAINAKTKEREMVDRSMQQERTLELQALCEQAYEFFQQQAGTLSQELEDKALSISAVRWGEDSRGYYRSQIIHVARASEHRADLRLPWFWTRLNLRDGGRTELVVIFHFISSSPGAAVAVTFLTHREKRSDKRLGDNPPIDIPTEPLFLIMDAPQDAQQEALQRWLDEVLNTGLAAWAKFL